MDIILKLGNFRKAILPPDADKSEKFFSLLNFSIPLLMGCYVFVNPLSMSALKELCYYLSILALMILLVFRKTNFTLRSPLTTWLALFSVWAVLGLFTTLDFSNTLHDLRGYLLEYLIVLYLLINFYNSQNRLELLAIIIIASATIFSIGGIILYYFIEGHAFHERFGLTFNEMQTAFMAFTTVFAATLSLRGVYKFESITKQSVFFFCFLILSATTMLSQMRSALIAIFSSLLVMCFYRKKTIIIIFAAIIIVSIVFLPTIKERIRSQNITQDIRTNMYRLSLEVIKDYPIAGVGYGGEIYRNTKLLDLEKYNLKLSEKHRQISPVIVSTHNTFLDTAVRTGIVGLALFCFILLTAFWMLVDVFWRRKEEFFRSWSICLFTCFIGYLIQAFFNDALYGTQGPLLYVQLAMIVILWNLARKREADGYPDS